MGLFVAVTIVVGLIFLLIPNIEMVTATIFLAGYFLGSKKGAIVGVVAEFLFSLLNPYGMAAPPLLIAQIISMSIVGYAGGLLYITTSNINNHIIKSIQFGIAGFLLTLFFDFLTTLSFAVFMAETSKKIFAGIISSLIYGLPFYFLHLVANTIIFALILPFIIKGLRRIDYFKSKIVVTVFILVCFIPPFKLYATPNEMPLTNVTTLGKLNTVNSAYFQEPYSNKVISVDSTLVDTTIVAADTTVDTTRFKRDTTRIEAAIHILENDTSKLIQQWKSLRVIPKSTIQHIIYKDPGDILTYLPAFYTKNLNYPGEFSATTKHAIRSNNLTFLLDGRPIKDPHTNLCNLNLIPAEYIHNIIVENELSSDFFNNEVNILTESYSDDRPYTRVYFHKGPSAFSDADITYGQNVSPKTDALLGFTIKGFSDPIEPNSYLHYILRAKMHHKYSPRWRFLYSGLYNHIKLHPIGPKGSEGNYATPDAHSEQIRYDHTFTMKGSALNSYYQNLLITTYYSIISKKYRDKSYAIDLKNNYGYLGMITELDHKLGSHFLTVAATIEQNYTMVDDVGDHNFSFASIGIKDNWFWCEKAGLNGKINLNGQTNQNLNLTGGLTVFFQFPKYVKTTIGVSKTVRYPTLFELYVNYYQRGNSIVNFVKPTAHYPEQFNLDAKALFFGNSELKPENIHQAKVEINLQPANSFNINTNFYLRQVNNYIDYETSADSSTTLINQSFQNFYGIDVQLLWVLWKKYSIGTNFNFVDMEDNLLYEIPVSTIYSFIQYKNTFFKGDLNVNIKLEGRYWDNRRSNTSHPYNFYPSYIELPKTWIINAVGFFEFSVLKFYISYENIFNQEYQLVYGYPMNGGTIHYGLRWEFWE